MSTTKPTPKTVQCPNCGKPAVWAVENPWRPFCSERCKLIDLGDWFEERNRVPDAYPEFPDDQQE